MFCIFTYAHLMAQYFDANGFYFWKASSGGDSGYTAWLVSKPSSGNYYGYDQVSITVPSKVYCEGQEYLVTHIDNDAFKNCSNTTSIILPSTVTYIRNRAFKNCSSLTYVDLGEITTLWGSDIFDGCTSLESIILPPTLTGINNDAFRGSNFKKIATCSQSSKIEVVTGGRKIIYDPNDYYLTSHDKNGILYTADKKKLIFAQINCENFQINPNTTIIGSNAFAFCTKLQSITIPQTISTIEFNAFSQSSLKSLVFNAIKCDDFTSCPFPTTLNYIEIGTQVESIPSNFLRGCDEFDDLIIPSSVKQIGSQAFANTTGLKTVLIQPSSSVLELSGIYTFSSSGVESLFLGRDVNVTLGIKTSLKQLKLGYDVSTLPLNAFSGCTNLTEVIMPNPNFGVANLTTIGINAFLNCSSLLSISLPKTVQTLGDAAFKDCSSLQSIELSPQIYTIPKEAFRGCTALNSITLPNGVTSIGEYAFANCSSLPTINIPEGVTLINGYTFQNCFQLDNIILPGKLISIINYAFDGCTSLSQITLPNSMNAFGWYAFRNCTSLQSVKFSEKFTNIPGFAFQNCTALTGIVLPEKITTIENNAFDGCTSLTVAETSPVLETISAGAFQNCNLSGINLPATVKSIGASAFDGNSNLMEVYSFNSTPPNCASANSFSAQTKANAKLYIPGPSLESYQTSICWKEFSQSNMYPLVAITSIDIKAPANRLRIKKTMELKATVAPNNSTFTDVIWNSSNPSVATISDDGTVTAISQGYTIITAKSQSLFAVEGIFELQVIDFLLGDSNESDFVTITDAVNIASYVMDEEPEVFNYEASDVNEDGNITLADASGVITIVLNDVATASNSMAKIHGLNDEAVDKLIASDFAIYNNEAIVPVSLEAVSDYVALQADIKALGGLKLDEITAGEAIASSHMLMTKRIDDSTVRVVVYSPALNIINAKEDALFDIKLSGLASEESAIVISNILATTADLKEHEFGFSGGYLTNGTTGIVDVNVSEATVEAGQGFLRILNATGNTVRIFTLDGTLVGNVTNASAEETLYLNGGIYIVSIEGRTHKVAVR